MLNLKNISKSYDGKKILDDLNLTVNDGEIVCIYGPSGIGKTTILKIIAKIIDFEGTILESNLKVSYVFQEPRLINSLNIYDNLALINNNDEKILKLLTQFEVSDLKNKYPKKISGGERQRINIIRAILNDADIYLLDEPFSSLDTMLKYKLMDLLKPYLINSKGAIFVTHDLDEATTFSNRICLLNKNIYKEFIIENKDESKKEIIEYLSKKE